MAEDTSVVLLFCFKSAPRVQRTLAALRQSHLASKSDLIVFCDGPRSDAELLEVTEVRKVVKGVKGFRSVEVHESQENKGLARSIIGGLTDVLSDRDRCIVVEDDIEVSPFFLDYMNSALTRYRIEEKVWHINGYNVPWDFSGCEESFCTRWMCCWGWGTWAHRWKEFRREPDRLVSEWSWTDRRYLNVDGSIDLWEQVVSNYEKKRTTWAIFWQATIQKHGGLCISPRESLCRNFGFDGDGTNCGAWNAYDIPELGNKNPALTDRIHEDPIALSRLKKFFSFHNPKLSTRIYRKMKRLLGM